MQKQQRFKTEDGKYHLVDFSGNHFINGKCANPLSYNSDGTKNHEGIGSTIPPTGDRLPWITKID